MIEELVAKLKLLERKISLLSKENSLQSCVILQLKKYLQPSPRWFSIVTEVFYFARKYIPGTIMLLNIVTMKSIGRTISKPTKELVMDYGRVKHPCDASQYKASSNFTLNEREKNPCVERKYKARLTFTCDYCQFSANSARFLQIHKENSHNKREVNVHGGADYDEVLNECGKSRLKLENKSVLSKRIQSKHQGTDSDEALNDCVKGQLKLENESVPSKHIHSVHQDRKYTCDFCQFSANSAKGLQIQKVNSHNKCEVAMHREAEHAEAPNECVKDNLKSKNESALRKHMQSKHQAFVKKLGLRAERWQRKFGVAPAHRVVGATEICSQEFQAILSHNYVKVIKHLKCINLV